MPFQVFIGERGCDVVVPTMPGVTAPEHCLDSELGYVPLGDSQAIAWRVNQALTGTKQNESYRIRRVQELSRRLHA